MSVTCLRHVGAQTLRRGLALVFAFGLTVRGDGFQRKLGVDHQRPLVRQKHAAVGTGPVAERVLKRIGAFRQTVLHDGFHPPLPERAARLFVGEHALQRRHLAGEVGDILLRPVDHRKPLGELLQIFGGALLGLFQRIAEPVRNRIQPLVDRVLKLRLAVGQHPDRAFEPRRRLGLRPCEIGKRRALCRCGLAGTQQHDRHDGKRRAGNDDGDDGDNQGAFGHGCFYAIR